MLPQHSTTVWQTTFYKTRTRENLVSLFCFFKTYLFRSVAVAAVAATPHKRYDTRIFTNKNYETVCFFSKRICPDMLRLLLLLPHQPTNGMISGFLQNESYGTTRFFQNAFVQICCGCGCCHNAPQVVCWTNFYKTIDMKQLCFKRLFQICCGCCCCRNTPQSVC